MKTFSSIIAATALLLTSSVSADSKQEKDTVSQIRILMEIAHVKIASPKIRVHHTGSMDLVIPIIHLESIVRRDV